MKLFPICTSTHLILECEQQCETVEGGCRPFGELGVQVERLFLVSNRPQDRGSDTYTVSPGPDMRVYP